MSRRSRARQRARIQREERAIVAAHTAQRNRNAPMVAEVYRILCDLAAHYGYQPSDDVSKMAGADDFTRAEKVAEEIEGIFVTDQTLRMVAFHVRSAAQFQVLSYEDDGLTKPTYIDVVDLLLRLSRAGFREVATARPELLSEASRALIAAWPVTPEEPEEPEEPEGGAS